MLIYIFIILYERINIITIIKYIISTNIYYEINIRIFFRIYLQSIREIFEKFVLNINLYIK